MRHVISIILENESGALSRVVGLFSQRGYNIESLTVAPTKDISLSCMTIQTISDLKGLEQIKKHLQRLVDVLYVNDFRKNEYIEKEIMLIKIHFRNSIKEEIKKNIKIFQSQIIHISSNYYIVQIVDCSKKLDSFLKIMKMKTKICEVIRSGVISMFKD